MCWYTEDKDPPDLKLRDPERKEKERQWELVEEFFAEFLNPDGSYRSYVKEYGEPSDFKEMLEEDLRDIITRYLDSHPPAETEVAAVTRKPAWEDSPFPGLRAFLPDEALIFHGRGREIDGLIARLSSSECRFIAVVGASGSGKSSLVAAGLLPALENNAIHGSGDWVWGRFTPSEMSDDNPFMALASAFKLTLERHGLRPRGMTSELEKDVGSFDKFLEMALEGRHHWAELLIFIDQFEELFTLVDKKYQSAFVNLLDRAAKTPRVRTVVTMRADFYHRCLQWPVLDALIAAGQYPLLAPGTGALHEMITRPAERAGLRYETDLAQRILDDTGTEPGALALMAYALSELWQASKGGGMVMTHAAYDSFNGVRGAIGKRAEDTFKKTLKAPKLLEALKLEKAELQAALTRVFRELIEVDERGVATRKRAWQSQVTKEAVAAVLVKALTDSGAARTTGTTTSGFGWCARPTSSPTCQGAGAAAGERRPIRTSAGGSPAGIAGRAAELSLPARPLRQLLHPRAQEATDQRRAVAGPGGAPRPQGGPGTHRSQQGRICAWG